jgi:hypothetical protein
MVPIDSRNKIAKINVCNLGGSVGKIVTGISQDLSQIDTFNYLATKIGENLNTIGETPLRRGTEYLSQYNGKII